MAEVKGLVRETRNRGARRATREVAAYLRPRITADKWRWRQSHDVAPRAVPVYVVGVQRSGTSMLMRGLNASPAVEVLSEGDPVAFDRFRLRPDSEIRSLVKESGQGWIVFKPLCDSHRIGELLDGLGTPSPGRAIWAYREVHGRVRSALAQFGPANLRVLSEIAGGEGLDRWQAQGLSAASSELIRSLDWPAVTPETAAALFWYVRNSMYFELGLDARADTALSSYDHLVSEPAPAMRSLCRFLDLPYERRLIAHIEPRPRSAPRAVDIDPAILERCDELQRRLDAAYEAFAAG
jgi:hypothetical protein